MQKILFVCHGNICRSTMAQIVFQNLVDKAGLRDSFYIDSAGTSSEELGNPIDARTVKKVQEEGLVLLEHRARQVKKSDYTDFDLIIGMDEANVRNLRRLFDGDPAGKVSLALSWAGEERSVADPWYSLDFDTCYDDVVKACRALLVALEA